MRPSADESVPSVSAVPLITGFAAVPWHSSPADVYAVHGDDTHTVGSRAMSLITYGDRIEGEQAGKGFFFVDDRLIMGRYGFKLAEVDCINLIHKLQHSIQARYASINPTGQIQPHLCKQAGSERLCGMIP
jgi:hypothetical protein